MTRHIHWHPPAATDENSSGAVEKGVRSHARGVEHIVADVADGLLDMRGGEIERQARHIIHLDDVEAAAAQPIGARIVRIGEEDVIARRRIKDVRMRSVGQREIRNIDRMCQASQKVDSKGRDSRQKWQETWTL
ncbi:hypothetical protein [Methylosinus sporium]|uniref:hypothetical protein n=1 Tax=Methylosinus sporium TaxID=428 RepID=UPI001330D945|nr:hypothetical protein [Methylosinus sporium]